MGEISILRPRRSLVSIPVVEAVYCESCASVSNSSGGVAACAATSPFGRWPNWCRSRRWGRTLAQHRLGALRPQGNRIGQSGVVDPMGQAAHRTLCRLNQEVVMDTPLLPGPTC